MSRVNSAHLAVQVSAQELLSLALTHDHGVFRCPVVNVTRRTTHYPSRLAQVGLGLVDGWLPWEPETVAALYQCVLCRVCEHYRPHASGSPEFPEVLAALRAEAVRRGQAPAEVQEVARRIRTRGHPFGEDGLAMPGASESSAMSLRDAREQLAAMAGDGGAGAGGVKRQAWLYLSAPWLALDPGGGAAAVRLAGRLGYSVRLLPADRLNPSACWELGLAEEGRAAATEVADALGDGRPVVIVPGAREYVDLTVFVPHWVPGFRVEVVWLGQALLEAQEREPSQPSTGAADGVGGTDNTVAYHDDKWAARWLGGAFVEVPRKLLARRFPSGLRELRERAEEAPPAGAEGPTAAIAPEWLDQMARARLEAAKAVGAGTLITCDPFALRALRRVEGIAGVRVKNLYEAVFGDDAVTRRG